MGGRVSKYRIYVKGEVFKGFEILEILGVNKGGHFEGVFKCLCGNPFKRSFSYMDRNISHGCLGCSRSYTAESKRKFVIKDRRLYYIWKGMNYRCNNPDIESYKDYGARGITVCDRWIDSSAHGFNNFYNDMGLYPNAEYSIDRIDVNGNYEPSNCRWATQITQMNNTRVNHKLVYEGEEYTLTMLARKFDIKPNTLEYRILRGWSVEDAVKGVRVLPWKRPYADKITDVEFDTLLLERYKLNKSLTYLATKYSLDTGQLSRIFRKEEILLYYKTLEG